MQCITNYPALIRWPLPNKNKIESQRNVSEAFHFLFLFYFVWFTLVWSLLCLVWFFFLPQTTFHPNLVPVSGVTWDFWGHWFLTCGSQILEVPSLSEDISGGSPSQNYFHNYTKTCYTFSTMLTFSLMVQKQWRVKVLAS